MNKERLVHFDLARSICVLWIVAVWHLQNYFCPAVRINDNVVASCISSIVLACFTCLSGFFLRKYAFCNKNDVLCFYKKRFYRFFCLLLLSVVSYGLIISAPISVMMTTLVGVSLFIGEPMQTLWYFSMIVFFYLITPIIAWQFFKPFYNYLVAVCVLCILVMSVQYFGSDNRLLLYYPFYVLGLFVNIEKCLSFRCFVISLFLTVFLITCDCPLGYFKLPIMASGLFALLSLCKLICSSFNLSKIVSPIAFSSMCAYLFHRQIYCVFVVFNKRFLGSEYMTLSEASIAVISVFVASYFIQSAYDKLVKKMM